eukprot:gene14227-16786_t
MRVVFYTLSKSQPDRPFFNLRTDVYSWMVEHWEALCQPSKDKSHNWRKQVQDMLSHSKNLFESGTDHYKQNGFWRLKPTVDIDPWTIKKPQRDKSKIPSMKSKRSLSEVLGINSSHPIEPDVLPHSLTHLKLGNREELRPGSLPPNLTHLHLGFGYYEPLYPGIIPSRVTHLTFGDVYNQPLVVGGLPSSITHIYFGANYNSEILPNTLPSNLGYLVFDPDTLMAVTHLVFGEEYNQEFLPNALPETLEYLSLESKFKQSLSNCPSSLKQITIGGCAVKTLKTKMLADPVGRELLLEKPRIRDATTLVTLKDLPANTFGGAYYRFMTGHGYSSDERTEVRMIQDDDEAYVMQRYREVHDFWHVLAGVETDVLGELAVKWLELIQTGLPIPIGSSATATPLFTSLFKDRDGRTAIVKISDGDISLNVLVMYAPASKLQRNSYTALIANVDQLFSCRIDVNAGDFNCLENDVDDPLSRRHEPTDPCVLQLCVLIAILPHYYSPIVHAYVESLLVATAPFVTDAVKWEQVKSKIADVYPIRFQLVNSLQLVRLSNLKELCVDSPLSLSVVNAQINAVMPSQPAGDRCSNDNSITSLRASPTSPPATDQATKETIVADFYGNLMERKLDNPNDHQRMLDKWVISDNVKHSFSKEHFSLKELLDAIESTNPDKSLAPTVLLATFIALTPNPLLPYCSKPSTMRSTIQNLCQSR